MESGSTPRKVPLRMSEPEQLARKRRFDRPEEAALSEWPPGWQVLASEVRESYAFVLVADEYRDFVELSYCQSERGAWIEISSGSAGGCTSPWFSNRVSPGIGVFSYVGPPSVHSIEVRLPDGIHSVAATDGVALVVVEDVSAEEWWPELVSSS